MRVPVTLRLAQQARESRIESTSDGPLPTDDIAVESDGVYGEEVCEGVGHAIGVVHACDGLFDGCNSISGQVAVVPETLSSAHIHRKWICLKRLTQQHSTQDMAL